MWHVDVSEHHCHEEFTPLYTTHWDPWASSVWRRCATLKLISRCCARCASLYPSHSNLPLLFSSRLRALYLFILFIRYSGDESQQQSFHMRSNDTQTQNWQTHWLQHQPPQPHPTPSSFLGNVLQFQIRLSHQFLPVKGKKEGRKAMKMMISLSWSRGLSHAIYFDIPPHQLLYLTILCTEST